MLFHTEINGVSKVYNCKGVLEAAEEAVRRHVSPFWEKIVCTRVSEPGEHTVCWVKVSDSDNLTCTFFHVWVTKIGDNDNCPRCHGWLYNVTYWKNKSIGFTSKAHLVRCDHICHSSVKENRVAWAFRYIIAKIKLTILKNK